MRRKSSGQGSVGFLLMIGFILINLIIGAWSVNVILSWLGKDIPTIADAIIGLFAGEVSIPVAIVGVILKAFGIF